jgi:hypothetical protein
VDNELKEQYESLETTEIDNVFTKLCDGRLKVQARSFGSISISRGSSDDCTVCDNDFIWTFKRYINEIDKPRYQVIKIIKVKFIHILLLYIYIYSV